MKKLKRLQRILKSLERVVVAYSGGVDSTFLLKMAVDALGRDNVLAVTAKSESYPDREFEAAKKLIKKIGVKHKVIKTRELRIKNFKKNPVNRCYYCKRELMARLRNIAERQGYDQVIEGTNYDDRLDVRHGKKALKELGIKSPLFCSKITKKDIRMFSRKMGLPTFNKPSFACLASRIPHHSLITLPRLTRIDRAEGYLQKLGFRQVRVRDYETLARIEVEKHKIKKFLKLNFDDIGKYFGQLGYKRVTIDLAGYRTGSIN